LCDIRPRKLAEMSARVRHITPDGSLRLREAWLCGDSTVRIAVILDTSEQLVRIEARRLGLPPRQKRKRPAGELTSRPKQVIAAWATDEALQRLRAMWTAGDSAKVIGHALGVTNNSILGMRHRLDLPPRPSPIIRPEGSTAKQRPVDLLVTPP
jgi:hypothetical protein